MAYGGSVRFRDILTMILDQPASDAMAVSAAWAQIVDILAQQRPMIPRETHKLALERASSWRHQVPVARRRAVAVAIAPYCQSPEIVQLFAKDLPSVAAPLLTQVRLSVRQWAEILPSLPVMARALIRERRDLPIIIGQMLKSYGSSDFALPPPANLDDAAAFQPAPSSQPSPEEPRSIPYLLSRVAAFKAGQGEPPPPLIHGEGGPDPVSFFWFETGADGIIRQVEGVAAEAVVGANLASVAVAPFHGVDGQAAGAFRVRQPYHDAHLRLSGGGAACGDWLISALPCFAPDTGRFLGYRGLGRRAANAIQKPAEVAANHESLAAPDEALRQFMHEMRTPLNAVCGFADMICAQIRGPVARAYQQRAMAVLDHAHVLLAIFEDLQLLGELHVQREASSVDSVDLESHIRASLDAALLTRRGRGVRFDLDVYGVPPSDAVDGWLVSQIVSRAARLILSRDVPDAAIPVRLSFRDDDVTLVLGSPDQRVARGPPHSAMRSPSDQDRQIFEEALPLGLDFVQRLIQRLVQRLGGRFFERGEAVILRFPVGEKLAFFAGA